MLPPGVLLKNAHFAGTRSRWEAAALIIAGFDNACPVDRVRSP